MAEDTSIDALIATGRYSLWHPTSKGDLLLDYPDLRDVKEFMDVGNPSKMLFVWFYACKTSRARELHDDTLRIKYALRAAWGPKPPKDIQEAFVNKKWGAVMQKAIDQMRTYEPEPRMKMKLICSQNLERVKQMLESNKDNKPSDWKETENYFSAIKQGVLLIQQLQPHTEFAALGVVEKTREQEEEEGAIMEWLHNQDNNG